MRYIFTRHGESTANTQKIIANRDESHGLTKTGIQQAETLAARLSTENLIRVYTSPLLRAKQTSQIVVDKLHVPLMVEDALKEFDCGSLEGRSDRVAWASFIELFQDWLAGKRREVAMHGGESFKDIVDRFMPFIRSLMNTTPGQTGSLLLVSHGGVLYTMLPLLLENITFEFASSRIMTNTSIVVADEKDGLLFCREWCGERIGDA